MFLLEESTKRESGSPDAGLLRRKGGLAEGAWKGMANARPRCRGAEVGQGPPRELGRCEGAVRAWGAGEERKGGAADPGP